MIPENWRRIAAIHQQSDGMVAAVWLAVDRDADVVHLYDCCLFKREVLAVIAEGLNARGKGVPVAWCEDAKILAEKLDERGCNMLSDGVKDTLPMAEVTARDIWERMRTGRFRVDKRNAEWLDEYRTYFRKDAGIPLEGSPLMKIGRASCRERVYVLV